MSKPVLLLLLLIVASPVLAQGSVEILLPPEQCSTARPNIHIVGRADSPWVSIELNGKLLAPVETDDSMFHALVWLPYGLNTVVVKALADRGGLPETDGGRTLEILCGPRIAKSFEKLYVRYSFHDLDGRTSCLPCHGREEEGDAFVEDADWCYSCHSLIEDQFRSHVTNNQQLCTNCHRMKSDLSWEETGVYTDMNPCFLCHKDKIGEFAQNFIHGPVAGGTCTVCHNPHGSEFDKNLRSPVPVLCLFCHTSIEERVEGAQHEPFADGQCVDCHDPHATGNKWVLVTESGQLCLECHEDDVADGTHRHPIDAIPSKPLSGGLKLNAAGRLECLTCHHPHYSAADFLLRTTTAHACLGCHPEYQ
jgi:predicted CXXCH cytochrome family protein